MITHVRFNTSVLKRGHAEKSEIQAREIYFAEYVVCQWAADYEREDANFLS